MEALLVLAVERIIELERDRMKKNLTLSVPLF
jgi:hypothetical protein